MRSWISGVIWRAFSGDVEAGGATTGSSALGEFVHGQGADVLGVQPDGLGIEGIFLGEIDHGVGCD